MPQIEDSNDANKQRESVKKRGLPVTESRHLRANPRNRRFARNRGQVFYGQISEIGFLPVMESQHLRADFKNRLFARNQPDCRTTQIRRLMRSTAFGEKVGSHKLKNTGQSQSQIDLYYILSSIQFKYKF